MKKVYYILRDGDLNPGNLPWQAEGRVIQLRHQRTMFYLFLSKFYKHTKKTKKKKKKTKKKKKSKLFFVNYKILNVKYKIFNQYKAAIAQLGEHWSRLKIWTVPGSIPGVRPKINFVFVFITLILLIFFVFFFFLFFSFLQIHKK